MNKTKVKVFLYKCFCVMLAFLIGLCISFGISIPIWSDHTLKICGTWLAVGVSSWGNFSQLLFHGVIRE